MKLKSASKPQKLGVVEKKVHELNEYLKKVDMSQFYKTIEQARSSSNN